MSENATITTENIKRMWEQLEKYRPQCTPDPYWLYNLAATIKRRWALKAFTSSLRGWGMYARVYYPPASLPRALVYKSNPTRREAKSKRIHARIEKATTRRMA